jgi:hypothetical protein
VKVRGFLFATVQALLMATLSLPLLAATNSPGPDEIPPLRPPRTELPPTYWEQHSWQVLLLAAVVVAAAGVLLWLLLRPRTVVAPSPAKVARGALAQLVEREESGAVLSQVCRVLRAYVIAAFRLPPGEKTTADFCRAIAGNDILGAELTKRLGDFLRECDVRKFSPRENAAPVAVAPSKAAARALELIELAEARLLKAADPGEANTAPPRLEGSGNA